jgi:hypothetical protein
VDDGSLWLGFSPRHHQRCKHHASTCLDERGAGLGENPPRGSRSLGVSWYPTLTRWANLWRAYGAGVASTTPTGTQIPSIGLSRRGRRAKSGLTHFVPQGKRDDRFRGEFWRDLTLGTFRCEGKCELHCLKRRQALMAGTARHGGSSTCCAPTGTRAPPRGKQIKAAFDSQFIYFGDDDRRFARARLRLFTHSHPVGARVPAMEALW